MLKKHAPTLRSSDTDLVITSLGGDQEAFGEIVKRYQSLLCSLAYSSVGDLKYSEDIAQEAFVEAWKKLDTLSEPEKLKSWLCGIVRFKASHFRRKEAKQPVQGAAELDEQVGGSSERAAIIDEMISDQQQTLLWQTLEKIPDGYREPLILFYRQQQSIEYVAKALELSEDAVKQRLSRGRKALQKAMETLVEDTLTKSKPGAGFTMAVLATIGGISPQVKAATLGAGAAKASALFKWVTIVTTLAALSGLVSFFFGLRASLDLSRTQQERRSTIKFTALFFIFALMYVLCMFALKYFALNHNAHTVAYAVASQLLVLGFVVSYIILLIRMLRGMRQLRARERIYQPESFQGQADQRGAKQREYRSRFSLAGIPLLHFRFGMPETNDKPIVGWVAGGDIAFGLVFAWGGVAIAPISVGILSVGIISIGAVGMGLLGIGTVGIGVIGFGASAVAHKAYASFSALGWDAAFSNGFSIARDAAIGPISFAKHINNKQAAEIVNLVTLEHVYLWVLAVMIILVIVPAVWHSNNVRKRMGKSDVLGD